MICDSRFQVVALRIASQAAALFCARVSVLDANGDRIADEPPPFALPEPASAPSRPVRVPFVIDGQVGEVVIEREPPADVLSRQVAQAVVSVIAELAGDIPPQDRQAVVDRALAQLTGIEPADDHELTEAARAAAVDPARRYGVILLQARTQDEPPSELLPATLRCLDDADAAICGALEGGYVVVLRRGAGGERREQSGWAELPGLARFAVGLIERLSAREAVAAVAGVGCPFAELRGIAGAYRHARLALDLGRRLRPEAPVHSLDRLGAGALVGITDPELRGELAAHLLAPLAGERELGDTLQAFFAEDCSPSATVQRLFVHRNTLSYRLDKIAALTGLDPRRFDDAVALRLALLLSDGPLAYPPLCARTAHEW